MTPEQWDRHEREWCDRCVNDRGGRMACPVKTVLHNNPNDEQALKLTRRLGHCSQFALKPPKVAKKNTKTKSKSKRRR